MREVILYVDDDVSNLTVLKANCEPELQVLTAASAAEALELARTQEVAVFLVDQRMPHVSGVELLEQLAREFPEAVRILITAYSELAAAIAAINRGQVNRYIRKPWDADELRAVLREALETYGVRRRVRELEQRLRLTERVYALGVVTASIAHELRNPLTIAMGWLEDAKVRLQAARDDESGGERSALVDRALASVEQAEAAVDRIARIVVGIDLSQRSSHDRQPVNVAEVLRLTLAGLGSAFRRHGRIETDIRDVRPVLGSTTSLGQVAWNLLVNAVESVALSPGADNVVRVRLCEEGEEVRLDVEDTGPGIPKEIRDRIFDPFFTTKPDGGTGLGLAISMRIVEELGGRITVDSEPGRGTRFSVFLPATS